MHTAVIGLGLIGGSVARRLRGFCETTITGFDSNPETLHLALSDGVIDNACQDDAEAIQNADFIILCLYPQANIDFIRKNRDFLKCGTVITDVSGIKGFIANEMASLLPDEIDFVGGHPMAGREVGGYQSSTDTLFDNASYLITPTVKNRPESIRLVRKFAEYIGCNRVITTTPAEHDAVIAYTSQLMHVVAVALCTNPMLERSANFSAGSLRDCTRVANINEKLWSELFLENSDELKNRISEMIDSLSEISDALDSRDRTKLESIMKYAAKQKMKWLSE